MLGDQGMEHTLSPSGADPAHGGWSFRAIFA